MINYVKGQETMIKLCSVLFLLFLFSISLPAATYYVDASNGNNNNSGLSSTSAWKTLSKVNSITFKPGDVILFKSGSKWREQLDFKSSGTTSSPIKISSYGTAAKPIISGANLLTGFVLHSGSVWKKSSSSPRQVFFNGVRGKKKSSISSLTSPLDWYWSSNTLYVYSSGNPSTAYYSPGVEAAVRNFGVLIIAKNVVVENLQVEKTFHDGVYLSTTTEGIILDNLTILQWTNDVNVGRGGVALFGKNNVVRNSTFGRQTGNDIADQGWAGFLPVLVSGANLRVENNKIYHNAIENESGSGSIAYGIKLSNVSGTTKISGNYIYHIGACGIILNTGTRSGDLVHIFNNKIEYPGQAGISAYKTRGLDGIGGKGYIYKNDVSYANRLGGDVGGNGNQGSGIHFNDGVQSGTSSSQPYMKWYCYENVVHNSQTPKLPNTPDANGISMDYNANNVEVYKNLIYNNWGKGIEIWNADNCKVYYNIVYGNDAGITVTSAGGSETTQNNVVYNNTFFKNYNGNSKGPNYNTELYMGLNGKNNTFKNNILYASSYGYAYLYNRTNTSGVFADYNLIYSERSIVAWDSYKGAQSYAQWRVSYPTWDLHSVNANPQFKNSTSGDFNLQPHSLAINKGAALGLTADFSGSLLVGLPDIGANEYQPTTPTTTTGDPILLNAMSGSLSGDARLGSMTGMKNTRVVYFQGTNGGASFNVNLPRSGTWYAWARMYFKSSDGKNSFLITNTKGIKFILGDNDSKYNQWHWDGYKGVKTNLGSLSAGNNSIKISGREPGLTLWIDQIILTDDPNYIPTDAKLNKEILTETVSGTDELSNIPDEFGISQNYPNPFNPSTTIRFSLPENSEVSLKIFDILGNEVTSLVNGNLPAGYHEVNFNAANLASGIYIYQIQADKFVKTMKMQLLK